MQKCCIIAGITSLKHFFSFKDGFQKEEPDVPDETLPYWVRVEKKRFNTIKNNVKRVKDKFAVPGGSGFRIYVNDSFQLIQDIENDGITHEEALKEISKIRDDI